MVGTIDLIKLVNAYLHPLQLMVLFCIERNQCHKFIQYLKSLHFRKDYWHKSSRKIHKFLLLLFRKTNDEKFSTFAYS